VKEHKLNRLEANWIKTVASAGLSTKEIAERYRFKYMDVLNVLRGNTYSSVTGILNKNISPEEFQVSSFLLKQGKPYKEIADFTGINHNKVRNIMGVLQYKGLIDVYKRRG